ncbi:MAG: hypothetical protein HQ582_06590 [Planctomycetes bacterium]|nr:hypothetical protein [Planctomycetota bacterium]
MKKLFSLCLASVLLLAPAMLFSGCSGDTQTDEPAFEDTEMPEDPSTIDDTGTGGGAPTE